MKIESYRHNTAVGNGITLSIGAERALSICLSSIYLKDGLDKDKFYELDVTTYEKRTGVTKSMAFKDLKEATEILMKSVFKTMEGDVIIYSQVAHIARYNTKTQKLEIQFHENVIPLLSGFKYGNFITIHPGIERFSSINAFNLYTLVKKYHGLNSKKEDKSFKISLEKLKNMLGVSYKDTNAFINKVLLKGKEEIDEKTDVILEILPEKTGKKITSFTFIVREK